MKALGTLRFTIGLLVILIAVGFYLWFSGDPLTGSWFAWLSLSAGIVAGADQSTRSKKEKRWKRPKRISLNTGSSPG